MKPPTYKSNGPILISAEMGLGHIRALYPLQEILGINQLILGHITSEASGKRWAWQRTLKLYNWVSRNSSLPIIGRPMHGFVDSLLAIPPYSEKLSKKGATLPLSLVELAVKLGVCNEIDEITQDPLIITSFYAPVIYHGLKKKKNQLICQICDSDLSRAWVPRNLNEKIHYIAPCARAYNRLRSYGVNKSNIYLGSRFLIH